MITSWTFLESDKVNVDIDISRYMVVYRQG